MLLAALPGADFNVAEAARRAGYKPGYIRSGLNKTLGKDAWFVAQLERLKAQNIRLAEDKVVAADHICWELLDDPTTPKSLRVKLLELVYRRHGALADRQIIETAERERELSKAMRGKAKLLAVHLMKPSETPGKAG